MQSLRRKRGDLFYYGIDEDNEISNFPDNQLPEKFRPLRQ